MTRSKYSNRKVKSNGYVFDSLAENRRYHELLLLQTAGAIANLRVHPKYELVPAFVDRTGKKQRAITYEGDFEYTEVSTGRVVCEDVKGVQTDVFKLKRKLFEWRVTGVVLEVVAA